MSEALSLSKRDVFKEIFRGQKINANLFLYKVFRRPFGSWTSAPKIVDVRTKSAFSCGPGGGEKLFDPWASGRKGQECPREIRTKKFMFMLFFSSLNIKRSEIFSLTTSKEANAACEEETHKQHSCGLVA